jgi:hypothetical protein
MSAPDESKDVDMADAVVEEEITIDDVSLPENLIDSNDFEPARLVLQFPIHR